RVTAELSEVGEQLTGIRSGILEAAREASSARARAEADAHAKAEANAKATPVDTAPPPTWTLLEPRLNTLEQSLQSLVNVAAEFGRQQQRPPPLPKKAEMPTAAAPDLAPYLEQLSR